MERGEGRCLDWKGMRESERKDDGMRGNIERGIEGNRGEHGEGIAGIMERRIEGIMERVSMIGGKGDEKIREKGIERYTRRKRGEDKRCRIRNKRGKSNGKWELI